MFRLSQKKNETAGLVAGIVMTLIGLVLAATAGANPTAAPATAWWQLPGVIQLAAYALMGVGATTYLRTIEKMGENEGR